MTTLVLAKVDLHALFGLIVLVVTVIGWFVNLVQSNTANGAPRQPKPRPKPQTGRSEIEDLLQELSGNKKKTKPKPREQPRQNKPQTAKAKQKQAPAKPGLAGSTASRQLPRPMSTALPSGNLGEGIRSHQLGNPIEATVQKEIVAAVRNDLGAPVTMESRERPVHPLVKILRDPNGVRNAVLLNEILQRPRRGRRVEG